ncbi:unnamed protein product (macronuclear) [Paramecium tetraurelia]|uniref:Uncharacterized protein n=1 Tax=Paramecium tetraurelia TaxID=5888 RepID=A0CN42_PARTE|nr:uncharacterized protein GSPATT00008650001 [Paramecium tetraurelia]CAK72209.1 unnamed protein product [Paramecium tetraurelia]|eukprot:XP_001439606.1 hypothetical protein (macronuclear) [Paramecium tetraurelia strain d4-2]
MNDQLKRMEKGKNNRCRLLHKVYTQKKKAPLNNMSFQIRVQNMIKQIRVDQFERSRCLSEYENRFPYIQRLNPITRPQNIEPLNLKLSTIRTTSRQSNLIIDGTIKKEQQKNNSQASLDLNLRLTSSPQRFYNKNKISIQALMLKDIITLKEQKIKIDQRTQAESNFFQNISSWSRKSSDSII